MNNGIGIGTQTLKWEGILWDEMVRIIGIYLIVSWELIVFL